ncbi:hypothetical protein [Candidatus Formimonas warabiya]|uniref:Uncharacterized protein n=1 Tax=Formimonas warabiya TaxID=1761012 RepID=A0A3G1KQP9_FORW1|nr:hypothetical protein [Candidatus Formimonas warabiya]ATW24793.1 hypothetical protein DCMF_08415 [Candidatus Formimonas warabiya]
MDKSTDNFRIWVIAGIAGVITRDIFSLIVNLLGLSKTFIWNIAADIFVHGKEVYTFWGHILGFITDITIGAALGVATGLFLEWRGAKDYLLKGAGVALIAWLGFIGLIFHNIPQTRSIATEDAFSSMLSFLAHLLFGLATVWIIHKYAFQKVPQKKEAREYRFKQHLILRHVPEAAKKPIRVIPARGKGYKHPAKLIKVSRKLSPKI